MSLPTIQQEQFEALIGFLKQKGACKPDVAVSDLMDLSDVMNLAEVMASSLSGVVQTIDHKAFDSLEEIGRAITDMKDEVRNLRVGEMTNDHIPTAGQELSAIVEATETATNTIMEAAESIMASDVSDPAAYHSFVNDKMLEIFEACAFQDITGQRVSKVVRTLNFIDERVSALASRLPDDYKTIATPLGETAEERRRRELILHGPQMAGEGVDQNAVDGFFD